jgi:hypothetical protein
MGFINFSIPKELVIKITEKLVFDNFIETGTYEGNTSFWAANHFKKVYTIEIDPLISKRTSSKPDCPSNIEFLIGNSKDVLVDVCKSLKGRNFFWLDGHWCFGAGGKEEECPLLFELEAIKNIQNSVIFIDDARCFLGPLPEPHDSTHWPYIDEIFQKLKEYFPQNSTTIQDDVIMCVPADVKAIIDTDWKNKFNSRFSSESPKSPSGIGKLKNFLKGR